MFYDSINPYVSSSFSNLTCKMLPGGKVTYRFLRDKVPTFTAESSGDVRLARVHSVARQMEMSTKTSGSLSPIVSVPNKTTPKVEDHAYLGDMLGRIKLSMFFSN
jgi:hypothetical protein